MAKKKDDKVEAPVEEAKAPAEEVKVETPVEETKVETTKEEVKTPAAKDKMVKVNNRRRFHYVQPSTGVTIQGFEQGKLMLDDTWLELQCKAGILERG